MTFYMGWSTCLPGLPGLAEPDGVAKKAVKPVLIFWVAVCLIFWNYRKTRWQNYLDHSN